MPIVHRLQEENIVLHHSRVPWLTYVYDLWQLKVFDEVVKDVFACFPIELLDLLDRIVERISLRGC